MDYMKKWFDQMGEIFLIDIGIEQNHSIIDFGCGKGEEGFMLLIKTRNLWMN
jgi:16S rRNA G1207 methylase RsmC